MTDRPGHGTAPPPPPTPREFIDTLKSLVHARRLEEALEYGGRFAAHLYPSFSAKDASDFEMATETAATLLALQRWEREGFPPPRGHEA